MTCAERLFLAEVRLRMGCQEGKPLDLGFVQVKPDLDCGGVPVEVECAERAHYGLGQALAYKYAVGKAALVVIAEEVSNPLRNFLAWASQLGIDVYVYVGGEVIQLFYKAPSTQ
ncbi:hypothetical protein [Pyrobaculum calidifontis]|uniref:Uncharacterized protein n=1 Tax=Pyrobaculum calidifontis (strain DSM 21063 / JCM 11548 / VA1) TaxID=410359 RepID=A3MVK3_PYRCJ|nr:hypothetical protein [Pyrobaculum calidifontis]ABO08670.1 conserved hypothetical protein [Pyrobaculum calidifontis JCM 11548]